MRDGAFFVAPEAHPAGMQLGAGPTTAVAEGTASWQPLFCGPHGQTALHAACEAGAVDLVQLLLK